MYLRKNRFFFLHIRMCALSSTFVKLAVDILCVDRVTVAYGKLPPNHNLRGGDTHGDQTHQVEHDRVEALHGAGRKEDSH